MGVATKSNSTLLKSTKSNKLDFLDFDFVEFDCGSVVCTAANCAALCL